MYGEKNSMAVPQNQVSQVKQNLEQKKYENDMSVKYKLEKYHLS